MTRLHFLGPDGSLEEFPRRYELQRLREPNPRAYLHVFAGAVSRATERLWVLDLHYHPHGHAGIVHALRAAQVKDVRILSERVPPAQDKTALLEELLAAREMAWAEGRPDRRPVEAQGRLEWRDRLDKEHYPYPHDRFVVVDEQLWHFGFAAGGSGRCLSAASGPWSAAAQGAFDFFEEVWLSVT